MTQVHTFILYFFNLLTFFPPSIFRRPKLQDGQLLPQHGELFWWAGPVLCVPASPALQREWCQQLVSSPLGHQEGVLLQHHPLPVSQQKHGQERDGELCALLSSNLLFLAFIRALLWVFAILFMFLFIKRTRIWKPRCPSCRARLTTWRPWASTAPRWWIRTSVSSDAAP